MKPTTHEDREASLPVAVVPRLPPNELVPPLATRPVTLAALLARPAEEPAPLVPDNVPDPYAFRLLPDGPGGRDGAGLWLIGTHSNRPQAFPLYRWDEEGQAFAHERAGGRPLFIFDAGQLPEWWNQGEPVPTEPWLPEDLLRARWAPELFALGGHLVLFYTARDRRGLLRTAYATSPSVYGPWTDRGPLDLHPRARELAPDYPGGLGGPDPLLGTIDATVAPLPPREGRARQALVVKVDGNALRWRGRDGRRRSAPTPLVARELTLDAEGGLHLVGPPNTLLTDGPHHEGLVEGQFFVEENGCRYMLYSAGCFADDSYRTLIGKVDDVLGGAVRGEQVLMDSGSPALRGAWNGPGHPSLVKLSDGLYALYLHAWRRGTSYWTHGERRKALRFHLSFRDPQDRPCEPFVVEDRLAPSAG